MCFGNRPTLYVTNFSFPLLLEIRTFEVLLRTYEVREESLVPLKPEGNADSTGNKLKFPLHKKRCHDGSGLSTESVDAVGERNNVTKAMARPISETRGHTGYLTFGVRSL